MGLRVNDGDNFTLNMTNWCGETTVQFSFPEVFHMMNCKKLKVREYLATERLKLD